MLIILGHYMVPTKDGAYTLYSQKYDEHYHSLLDGAYTESMKKHIKPALLALNGVFGDEIVVLDICFGLGYNTLCLIKTLNESNNTKKLKIISPELDIELVKSLRSFEYPQELYPYRHVIDSICDSGSYYEDNIAIDVIFENARDFVKKIESNSIDIVFQDAFSPKNNKELWTLEYFTDLRRIVKPKAAITTYTVSTGVRLAILEANFRLYEYLEDGVRSGTIGLTFESSQFQPIDMSKKLKNAPESRAFRDEL
jgi:tRNA U34 5-methylaminomethyl-2-thiouridine-forming methyltransferase MnmC